MKSYRDIATDGGSDIIGQVTAQANSVAARLADVDHVVAIMSGKGGVGKSTVTANLAATLVARGLQVGILDADINSSSIAHITGVLGTSLEQSSSGIKPAVNANGIKVMSVDLLLPVNGSPVVWDAPTQHDAFTWRTMMEIAALREFLADTDWGHLDYLLVDLPPGSDRLPNIFDLIPQVTGAIVVTIPSAVSRFVVEKSIHMAVDVAKAPVIGLVENMASCVCSQCGHEEDLFPNGHVESLAADTGVNYLGRIPFDRALAALSDNGESVASMTAPSATSAAFSRLADDVSRFCGEQSKLYREPG